MTDAVPPPIGREREAEALRSLLEGPADSLVGLVLRGDAGIGKTTLWRHAVALAHAGGIHVLAGYPGERESELPYAGLGDLVDGLPAGVVDALAEVDREALAGAVGRQASRAAVPVVAVARAALAAFRAALAVQPLLLAIDDVQWLDRSTSGALEYALRRLVDAPVRVVVTQRAGDGDPTPLGLDRLPEPGQAETCRIGPLPAAALDELIRDRLGLRLSRPRLLELERISGGNAFYALEIAPSFAADGHLSVPPSLAAAIQARILALEPEVREALLLAATSLHGSADDITRALGGSAALEAAVALGLLEPDGGRVRFTHPLLASVTSQVALPPARREAHQRLAAATRDPEKRAIHLARGSNEPDEALAAELEAAADRAAFRGAPLLAAELGLASGRLTPAGEPRVARARDAKAADELVAAGDPAGAHAIYTRLIDALGPGPERAAFLARLADTIGDSIDEPISLCKQALEECGDDAGLASDVHTALGVFTWIAGDPERSLVHCRHAARFAKKAGDEVREAIAIGETCHAEAILGLAWDRDAMTRALDIERGGGEFPPALRPSFQLAVISLVTDDPVTARPLLDAELARARRAADEPGTFNALWRLAELDLRTGDWVAALASAREALALARSGGIEQEQAPVEMILAAVLAHVGQLDDAARLARHARTTSEAGGDRAVAIRSAGVLGFIAVTEGRAQEALALLTPARRELEAIGIGELSISALAPDELEALIAVGAIDEAAALADRVGALGLRSGRAWHLAVAARGRALVASARGDEAGAAAALDAALEAHARLAQPFELGRTLLAQSSIERRAKHWAASRSAAHAALDVFDRLGAGRWSERAAAELARIPGRAPRTGARLSETERIVAELAASGCSNKEIAARLFVSVRAVEANLTRVYRVLGVDSRVALARTLDRGG